MKRESFCSLPSDDARRSVVVDHYADGVSFDVKFYECGSLKRERKITGRSAMLRNVDAWRKSGISGV